MSVGTYATLAGAKARLGNSAADDALLQTFCDQVNDFIESYTGRVLAPVPAFTSTLNGSVIAGATTVVLHSVTGLNPGDNLMFGTLAGTHESVAVSSISTLTVTLQSPLVNGYADSSPALRVQIFDGFRATDYGRCLLIPSGIWRLDFLEVASFTGGAFAQVPNNNLFLRPVGQELEPGWPFTEIWQSNIPSAQNTNPVFFPGFGNIRIGGGFGWPAEQSLVTGIALNLVVAYWQMRTSGGAYQVSVGSDSGQTVLHLLSDLDYRTLQRYMRKDVYIVGDSDGYGW